MNILLINLPSSKDRLAFQSKQLKKRNLPFHTLKAVSIEDIGNSYDLAFGWERPLRAVEIACFLSHKKAWQYVVDNDSPTLILEDDALLASNIKELLLELETQKQLDLITLEIRSRKKTISKKAIMTTSTNHKLYKLYQDRTGAAGYILWPAGAKKLLQKAQSHAPALADAFISSCYSLSAHQVEPAAIIQLDQCINYNIDSNMKTFSSISSQPKPVYSHNLKSFFVFKFRRIYSQLRMAIRKLSVLLTSQKRAINIKPEHF